MTTKQSLVTLNIVLIVSAIKTSVAAQGDTRTPEEARFANLAALSESGRRYFYVAKPEGGVEINQERLGEAVKNSAAWIRAVLKNEFVPEDLDSLIEGIPAALDGFDRYPSGKWPRFDCTKVEFDSNGHHFVVVQDSMSAAFFVTSAKYERKAEEQTADALAEALRDWTRELFRHAEVSLYMRPVRLTDFGVDTPARQTAWNSLDKRWRPTVIKPPKGWDDGLVAPTEGLHQHSDRLTAKLRQLDATIPERQLEMASGCWWAGVYAATDGRVLFYALPKTGGIFQGGGAPRVPDWFRVIDPAEIPMSDTDKTGAPATRADRANDPPN